VVHRLQLLYLYCQEPIDIAPDHPILRPGVSVSIGLDKSTKLLFVFKRFVDFCNEMGDDSSGDSTVFLTDLEFVHSQLLSEDDTAEASALMKNDRILVRKIQSAEREAEAERNRTQRESDRIFFQQLRHLMPDLGGSKTADVILDCRGNIVDRHGRSQRILSTTVRAHSSIICKRCPWLGRIIQAARTKAREEADKKTKEEEENKKTPDTESSGAAEIEDDEEVLFKEEQLEEDAVSGATKIEPEDDSEFDVDAFEDAPARVEEDTPDAVHSSHHHRLRHLRNSLMVPLPQHSPEAVKILLEYCYTNRVVALGHDAFVQACKTRPTKQQGPVAPYQTTHHSSAKRWPSNGHPTISFHVALAAISLAEEAGIPRLSLMCEISASQLLSSLNFMDALSMCARQRSISGNDLPLLRKAAMDMILGSGQRGVAEFSRSSSFRAALEEQRSEIIPTLLKGTMEAVSSYEKVKGIKRDSSEISIASFEELDKEDAFQRENERRKRRQGRTHKSSDQSHEHLYDAELDDLYGPLLSGWAADTAKRSLARMSHHLDSIARRSTSRGSFPFPAGSRRSNRRRTSQS
jgi:hypothetical protein